MPGKARHFKVARKSRRLLQGELNLPAIVGTHPNEVDVEIIPPHVPDEHITIICAYHALRQELVRAYAPVGHTLLDIVGGHNDLPAEIMLNGELIPREYWGRVRPKSRTTVTIRVLPQNDILRSILIIGAIIASVAIGNWAAAAWFSGSQIAASTISAISVFAFSVAINAIIPPTLPTQRESESFTRLNSVTGQGNQLVAYGAIPRLYGYMKIYPIIPMTGKPFTEIVGNDHYLRMLLVLGYGPLDIGGVEVGGATDDPITEATSLTGTPITIGETDIHSYDGVNFEIGRYDQMTWYKDTVHEEGLSVALNSSATATGNTTDNVEETRTSEADAEELSVDLVFDSGLFTIDSQGRTQRAQVTFKIEYRLTGTMDSWVAVDFEEEVPWYDGGAYDEFGWYYDVPDTGTLTVSSTILTISSMQKRTMRQSVRWTPAGGAGQYDVRITRLQTYLHANSAYQHDCTWTALRSFFSRDAWVVPNTVVMALRIKASDQLNGVVSQLGVEATSVLRYHNGSSWQTPTATRNPAWIMCDILTGNANSNPADDADLNITDIKAWADWCDSNEFYFDGVIDQTGTLLDALKKVCPLGRAAFAVHDNLYTVVLEESASTPVQILTPRNSWGATNTKSFPDVPHAVRVQFVDPDTWEDSERIAYADGYDSGSATKFSTLQLQYTTNSDQAWKLGRYWLAQLILRPETFERTVSIEGLIARRGDRVDIADDVILVGLAYARIAAVTRDMSNLVTEIVLDNDVTMVTATTYAITVRSSDGSGGIDINSSVVTNTENTTNTLTPTSPMPEEVAVGDLVVFGESGTQTFACKVQKVTPHADLTATLVLVPLASAILSADTGEIPTYDPGITSPIRPDKNPPPTPVVVSIRSGDALLLEPDGTPRTGIQVNYTIPSGNLAGVECEIRWRQSYTSNSWLYDSLFTTSTGNFHLDQVEVDTQYVIQLRTKKGDLSSPWTTPELHTCGNDTDSPDDPTSLAISAATPMQLLVSWTNPVIVKFRHVIVYQRTTNSTPDSSHIIATVAGEANTPATYTAAALTVGQVYYYWVRGVDVYGNQSSLVGPVYATVTGVGQTHVSSDITIPGFGPTNPTSGNFEGRLFFNTSDDKLYRYDGSNWIAAVAAVDITGTITETQIADNAISTGKLAANAVTAAKIAAGTITANELAASAVTADKILAGAVTAAKISAGTITADRIEANGITSLSYTTAIDAAGSTFDDDDGWVDLVAWGLSGSSAVTNDKWLVSISTYIKYNGDGDPGPILFEVKFTCASVMGVSGNEFNFGYAKQDNDYGDVRAFPVCLSIAGKFTGSGSIGTARFQGRIIGDGTPTYYVNYGTSHFLHIKA